MKNFNETDLFQVRNGVEMGRKIDVKFTIAIRSAHRIWFPRLGAAGAAENSDQCICIFCHKFLEHV